MWNESQMIQYLHENLTDNRFKHSISVRDEAVRLAKHYGCNKEKAALAGLLHDCAKHLKNHEILQEINKRRVNIDEVSLKNPQLMHGLVASFIVSDLMGIKDSDIINAIKYHTTGKSDMSVLEKIIYMADYVEPLRNFPGVDKLREVVYQDLDKSMLLSFNQTINYVIERGQLLHIDTIQGRNFILQNSATLA